MTLATLNVIGDLLNCLYLAAELWAPLQWNLTVFKTFTLILV
ncbi:Uncharacterised protein [Yersinia nurmii]|uniref:Uncharacterized protein n=1 Tax=Yersinia nurmii TaxID=685706 RepID=A0ABP1YMY3_9GAMM|nr:Uncharacterised protein [Yersinia nurmii]